MNKILLVAFVVYSFFSFFGSQKGLVQGNLNEAQLQFVKQNFNWTTEDLLIVNFKQPRNKCHYDVYQNLKASTPWWTDFYSQMDLNNAQNIFVYSDSKRTKSRIDSLNHFADFEDFFLTRFFSKDLTCEGVVIIHKNGAFKKKAGEYTQKEIAQFISELK
ncbi:hypothetical protein U1E44_05415 [Arenibacter sp. GZD96]|uniref:hypothetical protein n=1 Tax=Aurantibrevibacter litoralis TaxID=3106030 RepID=UPI002B000B5E|nr:hypothetical protein [Arenibacter sp. GZD-96]MEA1785519.1 hypothetical protein [Arenibacter sp. GZD-96]